MARLALSVLFQRGGGRKKKEGASLKPALFSQSIRHISQNRKRQCSQSNYHSHQKTHLCRQEAAKSNAVLCLANKMYLFCKLNWKYTMYFVQLALGSHVISAKKKPEALHYHLFYQRLAWQNANAVLFHVLLSSWVAQDKSSSLADWSTWKQSSWFWRSTYSTALNDQRIHHCIIRYACAVLNWPSGRTWRLVLRWNVQCFFNFLSFIYFLFFTFANLSYQVWTNHYPKLQGKQISCQDY